MRNCVTVKVKGEDILRVCKFSKTQPRPVAKNATRSKFFGENRTHDPANISSATLCQLSHEGRC